MGKPKISVRDFLAQVGQMGDDIPILVKAGADVIGQARNLYGAVSVLSEEALSATIAYVVVRRNNIIFQVEKPGKRKDAVV